MKNTYVSYIILILISFQISFVSNSIQITLASSMEDTTTDSYQIKSNILTLLSNEEYIIKGSCSECGIEVKKATSPTITLSSISIDNSQTGPFVIKKGANVKLILEGISKIVDKEINETLDDFEGAGIKFKSGSNLTISGSGTLIVLGNIKNGIKGASASNLIINSGTYNVTCLNNGIAADGSVVINGGIFNIETSEGDGIKSDPDYGDTDSEGSLIINDGTFNINSYNDGIQAKAKLIINGGTYNIKTFKDGSSANFNKDLYSAKGIKVSTNETSNISMLITGGTFNLNTADDSIHSDGNLTITAGTFIISSGDDAVHADQYLILGKNGDDNNLIKLNVTKSYEGLEGAQVYIYSGTYRVIASDDGINAAGDTTDQCRQGNMPMGPGQQGGNMGPRRNLRGNNNRKLQQTQCNTFHIYISGGDIYVNSGADGLDANGNIVISGGNIEIWGAKSGSDGDFIDLDGQMTITGGTLFCGGNAQMGNPSSWSNSQNKIYGQNSVSANGIVNIMSGTTTIKSYTSTKNVGYLYYTSPNVDSTYKFSISSPGTTTPGNNESQGNDNNNGQFPGNNNNGQFPGNNNGQMPGSNGAMPAPPEQGNNGTMPNFPGNNNNGQFPRNNNGQIPGSNGAMPDFPGNNNGQMPGSNGTMPAPPEQGNNGAMPNFPGNNNGQMPGSNGAMPDMPGNNNNGQIPGSNGAMPDFPGNNNNGQIPGNNNGQMPGSNGAMPAPPEQGNNGEMPNFPGNNNGQIPGSNGAMPDMPGQEPGNNNNGQMPGNNNNNGTNPGGNNPNPAGEEGNNDDFEIFSSEGKIMNFNLMYLIIVSTFIFGL